MKSSLSSDKGIKAGTNSLPMAMGMAGDDGPSCIHGHVYNDDVWSFKI